MAKPRPLMRATSMGHELPDAAHLDAHFARADVSQEDLEHWRKLGDIDAPDPISQYPDFSIREGHILVVGLLPEAPIVVI